MNWILRDNRRWLVVTLLIVLVDQGAKWLVQRDLRAYTVIRLLPHLNLVRMHNTGAAFSMFDHAPAEVFTGLAIVVSSGIVLWLYRNPRGQSLTAAGLCLVMGGAVGNAIDRITRGFVVDFIDFYVGSWHFAAFNVADSAITVGVCLLLLDLVSPLIRRDRA